LTRGEGGGWAEPAAVWLLFEALEVTDSASELRRAFDLFFVMAGKVCGQEGELGQVDRPDQRATPKAAGTREGRRSNKER